MVYYKYQEMAGPWYRLAKIFAVLNLLVVGLFGLTFMALASGFHGTGPGGLVVLLVLAIWAVYGVLTVVFFLCRRWAAVGLIIASISVLFITMPILFEDLGKSDLYHYSAAGIVLETLPFLVIIAFIVLLTLSLKIVIRKPMKTPQICGFEPIMKSKDGEK